MNADEQSRVEQRKRELYQPGSQTREEELHELSREEYQLPTGFENAQISRPEAPVAKAVKPPVPTSIKILRALTGIAVAGIIAALGYLGYQLLNPGQRPSSDLIETTLDMPVGADPASPVDITLSITNHNLIAIDEAEVVFRLPDGSFLAATSSDMATATLVKDIKIPVGVVASNETVQRKIKAYILGAEQDEKKVSADISFKFLGIEESKFTKTTERPVRILSAPIIITIDSLARVSSGAPLAMKVTAKSNTVVPLSGLLMNITYPPGYIFQSSDPVPSKGDHVWMLPDLAQGKAAEFNINGAFAGGGAGERVLHTVIGTAKPDNSGDIAGELSRVDTSVAIEAPFIDAKIDFGGRPGQQVVAQEGVRLEGELTLTNATRQPIDHVAAEIKIAGNYDAGSVDAGFGGIYRAALNSISWDERNDPRLASLLPGASVTYSFTIAPKAGTPASDGSVPSLGFTANVRAVRTNESGVSGEASALAAEKVLLATSASFSARAVHFSGPFKDAGPVPPKVDQSTQYTIVWSLRNTTNTIEGGSVTALLAPAVAWTNMVDTEASGTVVFNADSHTVTWNVGKVPAGAGVSAQPPKEVSFQVELTPAQSMLEQTPKLLTGLIFTGKDAVTKQDVKVRAGDIDAGLVSDPQAGRGAGKVTK